MRAFLLALALVAPLATASHTPGACPRDPGPALGLVEVDVTSDVIFYVVDGHDSPVVHVYQETNGIYVAGDPAHSLQREAAHPGDLHGDLPPDCVDPTVVPDAHIF